MKLLPLILAVTIALLAGCSKPAAPVAAQTGAGSMAAPTEGSAVEKTADAVGADDGDPCQLLQLAEVEAVLGPLAGPPYRSGENNDEPSPRGDSCRYVGRDLRYIELNVTRTGGSLLLNAMNVPGQVAKETHMRGQLPKGILPADSTFAGDWDDVRVIGCCRINAFLGEALLVLDFTGSRATSLQGLTLVNTALGRLDKPIATIDGRAGISVATQRIAAQKKHLTACQLVTRAEAEAIIGARLAADPSGGDDECSFKHRDASADDSAAEETVTLKVDWTYGFTRFREDSSIHAAVGGESADKAMQAMSNIGKAMHTGGGDPFSALAKAVKQEADKADPAPGKPGASAAPTAPAKPVGPWDEAVFAYPRFLAVKKDILVQVEAGMDADLAQKFASRAMEKL